MEGSLPQTREELRAYLRIDELALNECLMEQAETYAKVAEATALAEASRDAVQLALDELLAVTEKSVRTVAARSEERFTDKAIANRVATAQGVREKGVELLEKKRDARLWRALERSFEQRADMLKKLVDLHLRSTYGYSVESGVGQARGALLSDTAERNRAAAAELRRRGRS